MTISSKEKALSKAVFYFLETLEYLKVLNKNNVFEATQNPEETFQWKALSTAALICYARPFLKSFGLPKLTDELLEGLSEERKLSHEKFINRRNEIVAHSDSKEFEIRRRNFDKKARILLSNDRYLNKIEADELYLLANEMLRKVQQVENN